MPRPLTRRRLLRQSGRLWLVVLLVVIDVAVVAFFVTSGNSGSGSPAIQPAVSPFAAATAAVPTNRVTGSGTATVQLRGDRATITVNTSGLLSGSPHLMHIHGKGLGSCPPASAARLHAGHRAVSTGDGIRYYGPALTSLTQYGSTSGAVPTNIDMNLYSASGAMRYRRTIVLRPDVASLIRGGDAVIVIHGIDYNRNHHYDFGALGVSDLDKTLPGEATAPAVCGALRPSSSGQSAAAQGQPQSSAATYAAALRPRAGITDQGVEQLPFVCHLNGLSPPRRSNEPVPHPTLT